MEINSLEQVKPALEMGIRHFGLGWDIRILYDWYKSQGASVRKLLATV